MISLPLSRGLSLPLSMLGPSALASIAFCGDSITNSSSGVVTGSLPAFAWRGAAGYAAAILEHSFVAARNNKAMNSSPATDLDFGWDGITAADYLSSTTAISTYPSPDAYLDYLVTPADHALASGADAFVLHIGTNDLNSQPAATTISRISALATKMRSTGKLVFICTILPRTGNTAAPTVETFQSRIDTVNAAMPALALATGCKLVSWHESLMTGGVQNTTYFYDTTHPNCAGAQIMGAILAAVLEPYMGFAFAVPAKGDAAWLNANAYLDIDTSPANGIPDGVVLSFFTTPVSSIETVDGVGWYRCEESAASVGEHRVSAPAPNGGTLVAAAGTSRTFRGVCRYELVSGTVGGIGMVCTIANSGGSTLSVPQHFSPTVHNPGMQPHTGLLLTEPFTIPATGALAFPQFRFYGNGVFRLRQFGMFEVTA